MLERLPGLVAFLFNLVSIPAWFLAGYAFTWLNQGRPATLYWYYVPYWIGSAIWILLPGVIGLYLFSLVLLAKGFQSPWWDVSLGVISFCLFLFFVWFLYSFHTMKIGPAGL